MSIAALSDWFARQGGEIRSAAVVEDDRGARLMCATADIRAGERIVRVPRAAFVTLAMARKSAVGKQVLAAGIEPPGSHCYLAAYLLGEKRRKASPIAPYIDALPAAFPEVPLFCQRALEPVLRGSLVGSLLTRRAAILQRDHEALRRGVPALRELSLRELYWARTAIITRVFGLKINGVETEALVPLADMMNHGRPPSIDWAYDDAEGAFVMTALRDVRAGEELRDSYGRKPNGRFFLHYGFALASGADDEAEVTLALAPGDPRGRQKAAALGRSVGEAGSYRLSNLLRSDDTRRTFSYLRAAAANEREMPKVLRSLSKGEPIPPISPRNETAALTLLDRACAESLARFASQDEEAALQRPDLPRTLRNALLVIRGEKRLLGAFRRLAMAAIPLLQLSRRRFFTAAAHHEGDALTQSYLFDTALALAPREARPPSFRSLGL